MFCCLSQSQASLNAQSLLPVTMLNSKHQFGIASENKVMPYRCDVDVITESLRLIGCQ